MKFEIYLLLACLMVSVTETTGQASKSPRTQSNFDSGWTFSLQGDSSAIRADFNDEQWRKLDLPHDWSIEGAFDEKAPAGVGGGALPGGVGWYRKKLSVTPTHGARIFIDFDGVYWNSDVWLNGHHLGRRPNGYISFRYELTPYLNGNGENILVVRVDNSAQPNSRWYSGSGIYRHVYLVTTSQVFVDYNGTVITTPKISDSDARVDVGIRISNSTGTETDVTVHTGVYRQDGVVAGETAEEKLTLQNGQNEILQTVPVKWPVLWSIEKPHLYKAVVTIRMNGKVADAYETTFGIREIVFEADKGFFLNGKPTKILGVCNHHDLGCLGTAVNERALERQLEILRGMGVNAIRTSHNPPAPELLNLCDRMGFLVMDEVFDMWKKKKSTYDYSQYWDEWHERDLRDFIIRDRNHPSVIIWSIGNEIGEQWDSTGVELTRKLAGIVRDLDKTRPVTTGNNEVKNNFLIKSGALDLIGFNYNHGEFAKFPQNFPSQKFIATETTSALATRGHYDMPSDSVRHWPISWDKLFTQGNKDNTVSAYDHVRTPWGSTHEETWKEIRKHEYLSGMFIWTGFDYLGEPTPYMWPSRSSYFGVVDLAGFPKDVYYMYKSEWTKQSVLHLFPHWNWVPEQVVDLWAYYNNADEVELYVNGVSKGVKSKKGDEIHVMWRVPFEAGTVKVVSRKSGKEVLVQEVKTTGVPARIVLEADRTTIKPDGRDLSFVTVKVVDSNGNVVPYADNQIEFSVSGNAFITGVDNGDPTSHESFKAKSRKAFHGMALVVLQSTGKKGQIAIEATSYGLKGTSLKLNSK